MIVFDIETTGLDPVKNCMVSLGAVHLETGKTFYRECRVYPDSVIDAQALAVNGMTVAEVQDPSKPLAHEIAKEFFDWAVACGEKLLGGHNVGSFDVQFLKHLATKYNFKWPFSFRYVDLHSVAYGRFKESLSMDKILVKLGLPPEPKPHNGLTGAKCEADAFNKLFS